MSDPTFGISISRVDNEPRPAGDGSVALDAGTMPAGVYFVKMKNGQKSVSRKITIVR